MIAHASRLTALVSRRRAWSAAAWPVLLAAGAGLLAAGCSSGGVPASGMQAGGTFSTAPSGHGASAARAAVPAPNGAVKSAGSGAAGAGLTALPLPGGQAVTFTATLSLRVADVQATTARATQLVQAAGGYVSGEHAAISPSRHTRPTVSIQFKVPAAVYQPTLGALARLGTEQSQTQQAQDVTGVVADVNSRVASAQAAITQLRRLLTRAGSVGGLLTVQDQINAEEATLEALQSQQRALARETSYATVSTTITGPLPAQHRHHRKAAAGFLSGLAAGWRALRVTVTGILTAAGAALPFAIPLGLLALAALAARRWLGKRRSASARPAD